MIAAARSRNSERASGRTSRPRGNDARSPPSASVVAGMPSAPTNSPSVAPSIALRSAGPMRTSPTPTPSTEERTESPADSTSPAYPRGPTASTPKNHSGPPDGSGRSRIQSLSSGATVGTDRAARTRTTNGRAPPPANAPANETPTEAKRSVLRRKAAAGPTRTAASGNSPYPPERRSRYPPARSLPSDNAPRRRGLSRVRSSPRADSEPSDNSGDSTPPLYSGEPSPAERARSSSRYSLDCSRALFSVAPLLSVESDSERRGTLGTSRACTFATAHTATNPAVAVHRRIAFRPRRVMRRARHRVTLPLRRVARPDPVTRRAHAVTGRPCRGIVRQRVTTHLRTHTRHRVSKTPISPEDYRHRRAGD